MNSRREPFLWAGGAILAGACLLVAVRGLGGDDAGASSADASPPVALEAPPSPTQATPAADAGLAPWQLAPPDASTGTRPAGAPVPLDAGAAMPGSAGTAQAISDIRRQSQENVRNTDELLRQIDAWERGGQAPAGVNLDALRNNLVVARRAQLLAQELAESTQLADTPQRRRRQDEIVTELQQLQQQLRYDVGAPAGTPGAAGAR